MSKAVLNTDFGAVNGDDALHDGKPQTSTLNLGAQGAVETLEDALTFFGGNPRAVVGDGDEGNSLFFRGCSGWRCP